MPKVEGTYPHEMYQELPDGKSNLDFSVNVVINAVKQLLDSFEATDTKVYEGGRPSWQKAHERAIEFSCKSRGFSISGKAIIRKDDIHVVVNLPMLAMAFKGLVKAGMDKQIPKYLE